MNKIAVYTCITGNYDNLLEISEKSDKIDYICFTDNKNLKSASWKIKYFSEIDGFGILKNEITNVKKQRLIKILSHKFLSEYDTTLWVDANIKIQHNLYDFITSFDLEKCPIYTNKHPTRNCLYQEVLAVVKLKKDKYENIRPQVLRYKSEKYPVNNGMAETNIILRNNKDLRNHLLELKWAKEILQGSHRDQLSFNYVIWKNKLSYSHLNIQYRFTKENDLFHLIKHNRSALPYSQDFIKSFSEIQQEKHDEIILPENNKKYDVVYVLGKGSISNNDELRYSLRSLEKYFKNLGKIFLVGEKPDFISDNVIYIKTTDIVEGDLGNKDRNHWNNLEAVCKDPRLSEDFLFGSDDFIITKPSYWSDFIPRHTGIASESYLKSGNYNEWRQSRINTLLRFDKKSRYLWHPHMFSQMNKTKVLQCCKDSDYKNRNDVVLFTYYYNHEPKPAITKDFDTQEIHFAKKANLNIRHISFWDEAFNYSGFRNQLDALFTKKSAFEKYDMLQNKELQYDVSIIIPCYNSEKYIKECLDSVVNQKTNFNFEIICINDGSTDNTLSILCEYKNKYNFIQLINQENMGLSISRNNALKIARGKYVVFLDSDDLLDENSLNIVLDKMIKNDLDLLYFSAEVFFDNKEIEKKLKKRYPPNGYDRPFTDKILNGIDMYNFFYTNKRLTFTGCLQAVKRSILEKNNISFLPNVFYEDNLFSIQILFNSDRVMVDNSRIYKRRIRNDSIITSFKSYNHIRSYLLICKEIYSFVFNNVKIDLTTKQRVFSGVISLLMSQAKRAFLNNVKIDNFFDEKNKYNDSKIIDSYLNIFYENQISQECFEKYFFNLNNN